MKRQQKTKLKPVAKKMTFVLFNDTPYVDEGVTEDSAIVLLNKLQEDGTANILNMSVTMKRSLVDPESNGSRIVGRVQSFDIDDKLIEVLFIGNESVNIANNIIDDTKFVVKIGVRFNYNTKEPINITRFFITTKE